MALSERTLNRHNLKRAAVFVAHGLNDMDVQYARPKFIGYGNGTCGLCDKQHLKWLFSIKFEVPSGLVALGKIMTGIDRDSEVTISPVGSKCINDWLDALPTTLDKLDELRARWDVEMKRCKRAMKAKIVEDLCAKAGYATPEDAFDAYTQASRLRWRLPRKVQRQLANNAYGIKNKRSSRGTVIKWLENLEALLALSVAPTPAPAPVTAPATPPAIPALSADDAAVVNRAKSVTDLSALRYRQKGDFADILKKVEKAGKFASQAQRRYFTDMLKKLGA
jgi:hypothetical protein